MRKVKINSIEGFELVKDYYYITNSGKILSNARVNNGEFKEKKQYMAKNGYMTIHLELKTGKSKNFLVHRIVAMAFVENKYGKPQVNHIDEDKANNNDWNLEWATYHENMSHGTQLDRRVKSQSNIVVQKTIDGDIVKIWSSTKECGRNGFDQSAVAKCCKNIYLARNNIYKNYVWEYFIKMEVSYE